MGCVQSNHTSSKKSDPSGRIQNMKLQNGYEGRGNGPRMSTGTKLELKYGIGNHDANGRKSFETKAAKMAACDMDGEDELVDGWPKWLIHNIPRQTLMNFAPKTADSYLKIDKIGQGTYSNVYKARDKLTGKIVALKKVRFDTSEPESVKFMAREIMILQKLDHPNIVKLQGLATSRMQYSLYLVFDYMHSDLSRILSRPDMSLTEPQIKCYMQQLLSGLQHCHERGILHRDIKGSNLLVDEDGVLKIADFGLANFLVKRPLTSRVVTLWYRAPELLWGSKDYGVGIDLWSAGCLMAEMFAGSPILPGRTEVEQLHKIFKLCGTPSNEFFMKLKLSVALKPPHIYKSSLGEAFKTFPSSSLPLLHALLAMDPACRGTAASALHNEFFRTSPFACDLFGLPPIHADDDNEALKNNNKRMHTTTKTTHQRNTKGVGEADCSKKKSVETCIFGSIPGSSTTSTSSPGKEDS